MTVVFLKIVRYSGPFLPNLSFKVDKINALKVNKKSIGSLGQQRGQAAQAGPGEGDRSGQVRLV